MMAHSAKRRRLNPPQDFSDDDEASLLENDDNSLHPEICDRIAARNRFKSALEGIFDKYSRDFTGVGDEIDLETGELVVDNGHLVHMEDEGDVDGLLEASEDGMDAEGDSDEDFPDQARDTIPRDEQEADEEPLESLHLERSPIVRRHGKKFTSQAKDPKWQFPDLPDTRYAIDSDSASERDGEDRIQAEKVKPSTRNQLKSPGQSLWKGARSSKSYEWTPIYRSRRQSFGNSISTQHDILKDQKAGTLIPPIDSQDPDMRAGNALHIQADDPPIHGPRTSRDKKHAIVESKEQGNRRAANALSAKTGEWSVLEEQQLIRYRLNTHLSYAALASKFPGRTADMVRYRWRHLKKKMIELPISMEVRNDTTVRKNRTTSQRESRTQSEHPHESFSSSKPRNYHTESSNRKEKRDAVPHQRNQAGKSSSIERNVVPDHELVRHTKGQKPSFDNSISNYSAMFDFNSQNRNLDFPNDSNTPAEAFRQEEAMPYPLKMVTTTNNSIDISSIQEQEKLLLENMWKAFPPYDHPSIMGSEENKENVNHLQWNTAQIEDTDWQNHFVDGLDFPFSIPLDLADQQPPTLSQGRPSLPQGIQAVRSDVANNGHPDIIDPDILIAAGSEPRHVGPEPFAVSDAANPTTLASDVRVQDTNYTLRSLRSPVQTTCSQNFGIDGSTAPESTQNDGQKPILPVPSQQSTTARVIASVPLASIPNTTQSGSSPIALRSSGDATKQHHQGSTLPEVERPIDLTHDGPLAPPQTTNSIPQEVLALISRESSPLSSLSSRDPRIARPSDLSSTLPDNNQELNTSHDTILTEPALEVQPVPIIETITENSPTPSELQVGNGSNEANSRSSSRQSILRDESTDSTRSAADSARSGRKTPLKLSNTPAVSSGEQKLLKRRRRVSEHTSIPLQKMQLVDKIFRTLNESFEQSSAALQPLTKRKSIAKSVRERNPSNAHRTITTNKPAFSVLPDKNVKRHVNVPAQQHIGPKTNAQRTEGNDKSLRNASLGSGKRAALSSRRSISFKQNGTVVPNSKNRLEGPLQHASSNDDGIILNERKGLRRNTRATTPIDTYCYLLADPWPTDPLPADRIPGIWRASSSKDNSHTKREASGSITRQQSQGPGSSLSSISSKVENINTVAHRKPQLKGEARMSRNANLDKDFIQQQPTQTQEVPDSQPDLTPAFGQMADKITDEAIAVKPIKLRHIAKASTQTDHCLPLPRSPGRLAADGSSETPRKQSPDRKLTDILLEFGKGRPLTKVNLLSQDEVPSTSQETVLSFLNSQATQPSRPVPAPRSSLLAQHSRPRNSSPGNNCGVNGIRCGRSLCFHCTAQATTQEDLEF